MDSKFNSLNTQRHETILRTSNHANFIDIDLTNMPMNSERQNLQDHIKRRISENQISFGVQRNSLSPPTNLVNERPSLGIDINLLKQRQRQSIQQEGNHCDQSFQPQASSQALSANYYFKKDIDILSQKKSFNEYAVSGLTTPSVIPQKEDFNTLQTSLDSLLQVCNILPDSTKNKQQMLLSKDLLSSRVATKKPNIQSFNQQTSTKPYVLSSYLTSNSQQEKLSFRQSTPLTSRPDNSTVFPSNLSYHDGKEHIRKSFQGVNSIGHHSHRDYKIQEDNRQPTLFKTNKPHEIKFQDLTKHLDVFLTQNLPDYNSQTPITQNEAFLSFAASNSKVPQMTLFPTSHYSKEKVIEMKQQFSQGSFDTQPIINVQSPTPKFSLQFEKGSLKECAGDSNNKRKSPVRKVNKKLKSGSNSNKKKQALMCLKCGHSSEKSKSRNKSPTRKQGTMFRKQEKKTTSKSFKDYSTRLQRQSATSQFMTDGHLNKMKSRSKERRNHLQLNSVDYLKSPQSEGTSQKNNILYRTVSMDHYLSNGTTYLKGQRFLSPTSKLTVPLQFESTRSHNSRPQLLNYFLNLTAKKITGYNNQLLKTSFSNIKSNSMPLMPFLGQKFAILNLIKEFLMKQNALRQWRKSLISMTFKKKGYAIGILIEKLTHVAFSQAFNAIQEYRPNSEKFLQNFEISNDKENSSFDEQFYQNFQQRRARIFQRILASFITQKQKRNTFRTLQNNSNKKYPLKSAQQFSLNLKQFLIEMDDNCAANGLTAIKAKRYTKEKILRFMGLQMLSSTIKQSERNRAAQFFTQMKYISTDKMVKSQHNQLEKHHQEKIDELTAIITKQKLVIQKLTVQKFAIKFNEIQRVRLRNGFINMKNRLKMAKIISQMLENRYQKENQLNLKSSLEKWRQVCSELSDHNHKLQTIQREFFEKMLYYRLKKALTQWRKIVLIQSYQIMTQVPQKKIKEESAYDQYRNQTILNFGLLLSEVLKQRQFTSLQRIKQFAYLRTHQTQVIFKVIMKLKTKVMRQGIKTWQWQIGKIKSQWLKDKQFGFAIKGVLNRRDIKTKQKAFYRWKSSNPNQTQMNKKQVKTLVGAIKIFNLFLRYSKSRQAFQKWQKSIQTFDQMQLGLSILSNMYKKRCKVALRRIKHQAKRNRASKKSALYKAKVIQQLLIKLKKSKLNKAFRMMLSHSIQSFAFQERERLKQKKTEIHNQIVLLSEKDTKIRKQEAILMMKEQRMNDMEREIKERQRRIDMMQKNFGNVGVSSLRQSSKSPTSAKTPRGQQVPVCNQKMNNIKNQTSSEMQQPQKQMVSSISQQGIQPPKKLGSDKVASRKADNMPFQKTSLDNRKQSAAAPTTTQGPLNKENSTNSKSLLKSTVHPPQLQNSSQSDVMMRKSSQHNPMLCSMTSSASGGQHHLLLNSTNSLSSLKSQELLRQQQMFPSNHHQHVMNTQHHHQKLLRVATQHLTDRLYRLLVTRTLGNAFTSIMDFSYKQRKIESAQIMVDFVSRKILSEALIKWLKSVYSEELMIQESLEVIRERKLLRALMICERAQTKDEVLLMKAFREWKRIEYQMVLEGLKMYSKTLERGKNAGVRGVANSSTFMHPSSGGIKNKFFN